MLAHYGARLRTSMTILISTIVDMYVLSYFTFSLPKLITYFLELYVLTNISLIAHVHSEFFLKIHSPESIVLQMYDI